MNITVLGRDGTTHSFTTRKKLSEFFKFNWCGDLLVLSGDGQGVEVSIATQYKGAYIIKYLDGGVGYTAIAGEDIPAGVLVAIYSGSVGKVRVGIPCDEQRYLFGTSFKRDSKADEIIIDASLFGNISRFFCHLPELKDGDSERYLIESAAEKKTLAAANLTPEFVEVEIHRIRGTVGVPAFRTNRLIKAGEVLGYDYGSKYWLALNMRPKLLTIMGDVIKGTCREVEFVLVGPGATDRLLCKVDLVTHGSDYMIIPSRFAAISVAKIKEECLELGRYEIKYDQLQTIKSLDEQMGRVNVEAKAIFVRGEYKEAITMFKKAISMSELLDKLIRLEGRSSADVTIECKHNDLMGSSFMNNMAMCYFKLDSFAEALDNFKKVEAVRRKHCGGDHESTKKAQQKIDETVFMMALALSLPSDDDELVSRPKPSC